MSLASRFPGYDIPGMYASLRKRGEPLGIVFGEPRLLSNSRPSLELCELARDRGLFDVVHEALFRAYFTARRDIGDRSVLLEVAAEAGLDLAEADAALSDGRYRPRVLAGTEEAKSLGLTAVPTFLLPGGERVVGAAPLDDFRRVLRRIQFARPLDLD